MRKRVTPVDRHVGTRIASLRRSAGLELAELAVRLGLSSAALTSIEAGRRRAGAFLISQMAQTLGKPVIAFFDDPDMTHGGTPRT